MTHYETLGVAKTASPEEITKAYRAKAKQYHPDLHAGHEDDFKRVNEAYQVLKDPLMKARYDSQFRPRPGARARRGFDARADYSGFSDDFFRTFGRRQSDPLQDIFQGRDAKTDLHLTLEEAHRGARKEVSVFVPPPRGARGLGSRKGFTVTVPPGTLGGSVLRLGGQGGEPMSFGPQQRGDVLIQIRLKPDPNFRVEGADLHSILRLSPWGAALGTKAQVETLEGKSTLVIPPGSQGGQKIRIKGRGIGGKGDLFIEIRIKIPTNLSEDQRLLYEQLAASDKQT